MSIPHAYYDVPLNKTILLIGIPGSGKSTFCQQVVLSNLAAYIPTIFITTEYDSFDAKNALTEKGLGNIESGLLTFIDAYSETVGLPIPDKSDIVSAHCGNLTNLGIAITKIQRRIGTKGSLLVFDSLTSPYILNGSNVILFLKMVLNKFAGEGNRVFITFDEGSGKNEDLISLMSLSDGIIQIDIQQDRKVVNIVKHPKIKPTKTEIPIVPAPHHMFYHFNMDYRKQDVTMAMGGVKSILRPNVGNFVNIAWRDLVFWSGMLWDPKRFPVMMYDITKYSNNPANMGLDLLSVLPMYQRILFKLLMPKTFSKVKDFKKLFNLGKKQTESNWNAGIMEYVEGKSKTNEHYLRFSESYECWGFQNVGATLGFMKPAQTVGVLAGWDNEVSDWNVIELKCIGLGDPYCEYKIVPEEIDELEDSLKKDSTVIEKVNNQLKTHIMGFLLAKKPLMERPTLGSDVHMHELQQVTAASLEDEQVITVFRMGGAKAGKMLGEQLLEEGLSEKEAVKLMIDFMNYCKVGKVTLDDTIRIKENSERYGMKTKEPSCYFTTGFLNGFFYAVQNQHVKETKCIGVGDAYCEWELR